MKLENKNMNIPEMSVGEAVETLLEVYGGAVMAGLPFRELPTPFLWGPPGIGKSDGVRQLAAALEEQLGLQVVVTDVRLLLFSPVDLRGVPVADEHRQFTNWLRPRIFDMDPGEDVINILLLDELSAAPQSVQAAAYQLTLDRRIGEHALPENCIVIAAGNRTTDQSVAYKMPKALANRLMHYSIAGDFPSWKRWALGHGIDPRVVGYLSFDQSRLCVEPEASDLAYPTPRSWAFVSALLRAAGQDRPLEDSHSRICACVGTDTAVAFENWCRVYTHLPDTEDILMGTCKEYPKTQDVLYALSASLLTAIARKGKRLDLMELDNACRYAARFPADFAASFFRDLSALQDPGLRVTMMKCRTLQDWLKKNQKYL